MIGIIGAMDIEVQNLKNAVTEKQVKTVSGIDFVSGKIHGTEVVIAKAGVGKVNAAVCAQTMILLYNPEAVINTGVAGSLSSKVGVGDIVIATATVQHDMDTSSLGDPIGFISGIDMVELPCDTLVYKKLLQSAEKIDNIKIESGIIASGDVFLNSSDLKEKIVERFGAVAGEMEGASIGQVCVINHTPYCVLRAISDNADGSSHVDYPTFVSRAAEVSTNIMLEFLK